ncbi:hypothetical protein EIP91_009742 [Steccherinum ochraceum]|uniref:Uncharacterized protein n=1 Tax=Steccherinum ochraceum TaxID=92696 RepID=A0A4R0R1A8_9APHY|nr:hypothetical protein EIP91_009742 [Steccherinum ochraceum]
MASDISFRLAGLSLANDEPGSSDDPSQAEDVLLDTPQALSTLLRELSTKMPSQPKQARAKYSPLSQPMRTPWDGKQRFKLADRRVCMASALKQLPSTRLPMYMDPFLIVAPPEQLVRAWYGIPVIDPLLLEFAVAHNLGRLAYYMEDGPVLTNATLARYRVLQYLGKRLGVQLLLEAGRGCGYMIVLCTNQNLRDIPEGLDVKGREIANLLGYPEEDSIPQWRVAREQHWEPYPW